MQDIYDIVTRIINDLKAAEKNRLKESEVITPIEPIRSSAGILSDDAERYINNECEV